MLLLCACAAPQPPPPPPPPPPAPAPQVSQRREETLEVRPAPDRLAVEARVRVFEVVDGRERETPLSDGPLSGATVLVRSAAGDHAVLATDADGRAELDLTPILVQLSRRCEDDPAAAEALAAAGEASGLRCRVELEVEPRLDLGQGLLRVRTAHRLDVELQALRQGAASPEVLATWRAEGRRRVSTTLELESPAGPLELRTGSHGRGALWLAPLLERGVEPLHAWDAARDVPAVQHEELVPWALGTAEGRLFLPFERRVVSPEGVASWSRGPRGGRIERAPGARELLLRPDDPQEPVAARWTAPRAGEWRVAVRLRPVELAAAAEVVVALDGQDLFWRRMVPGGADQECEFEGTLRLEAGSWVEARVRRAHVAPAGPIGVGLAFSVDPGSGDPAPGQRQWAADARASSEFARDRWCARQATGAPDTHRAGDLPTAWASLQPDGTEEWLELVYARPVHPVQARIHETHNPGAVVKVEGRDVAGAWWVLWEGPPAPGTPAPRWLELDLAATERPIDALRLTVASSRVGGWNEIDAVELLGESDERELLAHPAAPPSTAEEAPAEPPPLPAVPPRPRPDAGDGWSDWLPAEGAPDVAWRVRSALPAREDGRAEQVWQVWNRGAAPLRLALTLVCEEPAGRREERWACALGPGERAESPGQWTECARIAAVRARAEPVPAPEQLELALLAPGGERIPLPLEPEQLLAAREQLARHHEQVRAECLEAQVERAAQRVEGPARAAPWLRASLLPAPEPFLRRAQAELLRRHGIELRHLSRADRVAAIELFERPASLLRPPPDAPEWPVRAILGAVRRLGWPPGRFSPRRKSEQEPIHALHPFYPWPAPELLEDGVWLAGRSDGRSEWLELVDGTREALWLFRGEVCLARLDPGEEAVVALPRSQFSGEPFRLLYQRELRR